MLNLVLRNLKIFFREKSSVFFSLLGVFIIIGLYVLFLGDTFVRGMENVPGIRFLMDSWIMAGLLAVTSITTTMGAYGAMVDDKTSKRIKDFNAAPIKRYKIAGGYVLSSYIIGVIMSFLTFILAEIYIVSSGGELLSAVEMAQASGLILLNVLSSSAMIFFIVSFFNSNSAFSTASTVIGTLIGFLTGIYIPMGSLPESVQTVIKLFPVSHGGVLFRQLFMEAPMAVSFKGASAEAVNEFQEAMGMVYKYGSFTADAKSHIIVLAATAFIFYILAVINLSRKRK